MVTINNFGNWEATTISAIVAIAVFLIAVIGLFIKVLTKYISVKRKIKSIENEIPDDDKLLTKIKEEVIKEKNPPVSLSFILVTIAGILLALSIINIASFLCGGNIDGIRLIQFMFWSIVCSGIVQVLQIVSINLKELGDFCLAKNIEDISNKINVKRDLKELDKTWNKLHNKSIKKMILDGIIIQKDNEFKDDD